MKQTYQTIRQILSISTLVLVGACSQMSLGTLWSLRGADFTMADPSVMRIAMALPDGANLENVTLDLRFTRNETTLIDEKVSLKIITSGAEIDRVGFPTHLQNRFILQIPQSSVDKVVKYQRLFVSERQNSQGAEASFGINARLGEPWLDVYCSGGNNTMRISTWILVDKEQGYLPLIKNSRLGKLLDQQANSICSN